MGVNHCLVKWSIKGTPRKIESKHIIVVNYWLQPNKLINHLWLVTLLLTLLSTILLAKHGDWSYNLATESTYNINYKEHVNNLFSTDSTARWLHLRINNHAGQATKKKTGTVPNQFQDDSMDTGCDYQNTRPYTWVDLRGWLWFL